MAGITTRFSGSCSSTHPITTIETKQNLRPYAAQLIGQLAADGVAMRFEDVPDQQMPGLCHRTLIIEQTHDVHG